MRYVLQSVMGIPCLILLFKSGKAGPTMLQCKELYGNGRGYP